MRNVQTVSRVLVRLVISATVRHSVTHAFHWHTVVAVLALEVQIRTRIVVCAHINQLVSLVLGFNSYEVFKNVFLCSIISTQQFTILRTT